MRVPVQNDGTEGTPNHHCNPADNPRAGNQTTNTNACTAAYPHIGADANGFYVTANEYDFYGDEFQSSNIYAFSKRGLEAGDARHVLLETQNAEPVRERRGRHGVLPQLQRSGRGHVPDGLQRAAHVERAGRVVTDEHVLARLGRPERAVAQQGADGRRVRRSGPREPESRVDAAGGLPERPLVADAVRP